MNSVVSPVAAREYDRYSSLSASGSRAAVGSSRMRTGASAASERAMASRCHSPPDTSTPPRSTLPRGVSYPCGSRQNEVVAEAGTRQARLHRGIIEAAGSADFDVVADRERIAREVLEHHAEQPVHGVLRHSAIGVPLIRIRPPSGR